MHEDVSSSMFLIKIGFINTLIHVDLMFNSKIMTLVRIFMYTKVKLARALSKVFYMCAIQANVCENVSEMQCGCTYTCTHKQVVATVSY